ncbi:MAG TPA: DUF222 domain-containing protein [Mycobacteriales bacterium]|nr:DUF222 domain-containing protein [Mycobacteriales bacterium]
MSTSTITGPSSVAQRRQRLAHLHAEIVELASQLTAASARLTRLIGEFDDAEGWGEWGMRSTAHWLSWHCGMGLGAAREQVRVARSLRELPVISEEYAAGRLSYSKVRALTRFATAATDGYLASIGRHATGAQIEKLAKAARRARTGDDVRGQYATAYLTFAVSDDGSVVGSFRLPPAEGAEFIRAIEAGAGQLPDYASEGEEPAAANRRKPVAPRGNAWVLTAMARQFLDALINGATPSQAERFQVVIHTTSEQLARSDTDPDTADAEDAPMLFDDASLHSSTARRLTCDCPASSVLEGIDGEVIHVGRRSRRITGRLRRAVEARDRGHCRAPGCTNRATEIHHIRHWANGGATCLRNLISLCDGHHWLVHEGGFTVVRRSEGRWALLGGNGVLVDAEPPTTMATGALAHDPEVDPGAVTGAWCGDRMSHYATEVILTHIGAFEPQDTHGPDVSAETLFGTAA